MTSVHLLTALTRRATARATRLAVACAAVLATLAAPVLAQGAGPDSSGAAAVRLGRVRVAPNPAWQCQPDSALAGSHATDAALCDARFRVATIEAALAEHQQLGVPDACARAVAAQIELAMGEWALGDSAAAHRAELTTCDGRTLTSDSLTMDEHALVRLCPGQVWSWTRRGQVTCTALAPGTARAARHQSGHTRRAIASYGDQMYSRARDEALAALSSDSLDATSEAVYGASLAMLGRDTEAVASLRRAVRLDPGNGWGWGMLAWTLYTDGQYAAVDSVARQALAIDGDNALALQYLGLGAARRNDTATAVAALARAAALAPGNGPLRADYASALRAAGKLAAAEREAREAVRLAPKYELGHAELGRVLEAEGRTEEAVAAYRRAHDLADWDSEVAARLAALSHR